MSITLTPNEARVIGCLLEKAVTTPDQYPLTLNALTGACNQKSSREPVMNLDRGEVERTVRALEDKHIVRVEENFKTQIDKYTHRFCNTPFSDYQFDTAQYAVVCVLLLRGARTPGELRSHCQRMHEFEDNRAVSDTLNSLAELGVTYELPRQPGRRDSEHMHLFYDPTAGNQVRDVPTSATRSETMPQGGALRSSGDVAADSEAVQPEAARPLATTDKSLGNTRSDLEQRVKVLEGQVRRLMEELGMDGEA